MPRPRAGQDQPLAGGRAQSRILMGQLNPVRGLAQLRVRETDTSTSPTCRSTHHGEFATRITSVTLPHNPASSAAVHPVMLITCDSPSRKPLVGRSAMNGRCRSARPITGRYTVLVKKDIGGLRRESTRMHMRFDSGGIQGIVEFSTRTNQNILVLSNISKMVRRLDHFGHLLSGTVKAMCCWKYDPNDRPRLHSRTIRRPEY